MGAQAMQKHGWNFLPYKLILPSAEILLGDTSTNLWLYDNINSFNKASQYKRAMVCKMVMQRHTCLLPQTQCRYAFWYRCTTTIQ